MIMVFCLCLQKETIDNILICYSLYIKCVKTINKLEYYQLFASVSINKKPKSINKLVI